MIVSTKPYIGVVVDNKDPENIGKCRVRIYGLMDNVDDMPDNSLPWAYPSPSSHKTFSGGESGGYGDIDIPKIGTNVEIRFVNGDITLPEWSGITDINESLRQYIIDGGYENGHSILFDEDEALKIVYTKNNGMVIELKGSTLTINADSSITIEHKETSSIIELIGSKITIVANSNIEVTATNKIELNSSEVHANGNTTKLGTTPIYSAVAAEPLFSFLEALALACDGKWPPTPGVLAQLAQAARTASTSNTVKVTL